MNLGATSIKGQVCNDAQKCAAGLYCKAGNCDTLPTCLDQSVPCNTFASHEALKTTACCADLKCLPFNGLTVCQKLPTCFPEGAYCEATGVSCCAGNTCEKHTCDKTGKVAMQCRKTGETAVRHKYEADEEIEEDKNRLVAVIKPNDTLDLKLIGTNQLSIRADTTGLIGSIVFDFDAKTSFRTESSAPYSLGSDTNGDYKASPELVVLGKHTVSAMPYTLTSGLGSKGTSASVSFTIINTGPAIVAPVPAPVPALTTAKVCTPRMDTCSGTPATCVAGQSGFYLSNPISVVSMLGGTVTFKVKQTWKVGSTVSWIAVTTNGGTTCAKTDSVMTETPTYTATCTNNVATVVVYVHDGSFTRPSDITSQIPACCSPSLDVGKKIAFTFSVPCTSTTPTLCV
jgi:hypothetical protein